VLTEVLTKGRQSLSAHKSAADGDGSMNGWEQDNRTTCTAHHIYSSHIISILNSKIL